MYSVGHRWPYIIILVDRHGDLHSTTPPSSSPHYALLYNLSILSLPVPYHGQSRGLYPVDSLRLTE